MEIIDIIIKINGRVTQWLEYFADNEKVLGSNPSTPTKKGMKNEL
jgi:hypothetical protein